MSLEFFDMQPKSISGSWILGSPVDEIGNSYDARKFLDGKGIDKSWHGQLTFSEKRIGNPMSLTFNTSFAPIVSQQVGEAVELIASKDIQRIPILIPGHPGKFEILNIVKTIDCVDETNSGFVERWGEDDGRPEKTGQYKTIFGLRIIHHKAAGAHLFRLKGWETQLIASFKIKELLERYIDIGVVFKPV